MVRNVKNAKDETLRRAFELQSLRLGCPRKGVSFLKYLEREVWPKTSVADLRRPTQDEENEILGYGPEGV